MGDGALTSQDKKLTAGQEATGKAKPVAIDPKAKDLAQTARFTPEERLAAIKELLAEDIKRQKDAFDETLKKGYGFLGSNQYSAHYHTTKGDISIVADQNSDFSIGEIRVKQITKDINTERAASITSDGNFVSLTRTIKTYYPDGFTKSPKETLNNEWAERYTDNLINEALAVKKNTLK